MSNVLIRNRKGKTRRGKGDLKTGVDRGLMLLEAKKCQGLPEPLKVRREAWNGFSSESPERTNPADTSISDFCTPDCERINVFCLSYPVCGNLS